MGLVKRFFHGKHVKPTSSKNTIESDDSYLNYLPRHVVDDSLNREDDVSSIHYGESVGTPFTAKALGHANRNIKRSTEQSRAELNFLVSVNSSPMKILENTDGEVSTMGGDSILHESENESESKKEGASKVTHSLLGERKEEEEEDYELEIGDDGHVQSEGEQSTLDGVEVYNPREGPKTKSTDMSVFCLSLLTDENSRDAKSLPERIVRDTLKRHLDLYNNEMELAKNIGTDECESQVDNFKALRNDPKKMETLAQTLVSQGHADKAITLYKQLLVHQRKHPDADPSETLSKLAILHLYQGNLKSSHGYSKQALKLNREESRQAQIATSLMSMGLLYFGCDQSDKALRTWREALQMVCLVFGYDHTYVAIILNNIGCLHYHRGDFSASQKIFSESLDLQRKFLSSSVGCINNILLDIATTKGNIATTMAKVDDIDSAMALFEEVLSLQESVVVDREHFLVRLTSQNMDRISRERADTFSSQPAAPVRNIFGTSVMTCQTKGTSEAAFLQTCETFPIHRIEGVNPSVFGDMDGIPMRRIGAQSPLDAIDATDNLDVILLGSLSNEYSPSQRVRAAVLAWFGKTLEEEDAKTLPFVPFGGVTPRKRSCVPVDLDQDNVLDAELHLEGINQQAAEHLEHNEVDEALELFQSVLRSHKDKYGAIHHLVGTANHNIGVIYLFAERYTHAMTFFRQAVAVRRAALGSEHPDVSASLMKIGMIQLVRRDSVEALDTFLQVLKLVRKVLGYGHIQVARVLNNVAVTQYDLGANLDAFHTFQEAHEIQRRLLLLSHTENITVLNNQTKIIELALANTLSNMGFIYCRQNKYGDSVRMLQEASMLRRKHLGSHDLTVENGDDNLLFVRGRLSEAKKQEPEAKSEKTGFLDFVGGALNLRCDVIHHGNAVEARYNCY